MDMTAFAPRAGRREWVGLAVLALPCLVYAMDLTVLNLALPALSADLHPSGTQLLWIVDIYGFMVAGALITMGALGDRIGARRLLLIGAGAFAGASLLAAFATGPGVLIVARALLGLAGATLAPSTLSLIRTMFPDHGQRTVAIGVWVTSYSLGAAIGPLAGGALLEVFWWGSVFLLAIPVMALLLIVGPRLLPEKRDPEPARLDVSSAALSLAAVVTAIYGLKQLATSATGLESVLWVAIGLLLGAMFVRRQQRLTDPLIDLRLFRAPAFSAALGTNLVAFFVVFGMSLFLAQYLQSVAGLSPLQAGLWSVPEALGFIAGSMLAPRLASRWSATVLIGAGMGVGALGYLVVARTDDTLLPLVGGSTVAAVGLAVVITLVTDLAVGAASADRAGAAAATAETSSELGGALGLAILGSIGAAIYRAGVGDALPGGVPAPARETLGGALDARTHLSPAAADHLLDAARDAFTHALTVTATIGAATLLVAGLTAVALLRSAARPAAAAGMPTDRACAPAVGA
jgi:DHA2 family multidrug resistance protein-like MFS transporter